ncbi:hypothetical protein MASR1M8_02480 [Thermomonas brevis]
MSAPRKSRPARWLLALLVVLATATLGYLLVGATDSALTVWAKLRDAPQWLRIAFLAALALLGLAAGWIVWRLLHPGAARKPVAEPLVRERIEQRAAALPAHDPIAADVQRELADGDARRDSGWLYVALFGDISAGKSSLMTALSGVASRSDVVGGTTREVAHAQVEAGDSLRLDLADVPGSNEVDGAQWQALAHAEAARAHALVYVADGEPTRAQDAELRAIGRFGKPLLLALNKADRYREDERAQLLQRLRARYADVAMRVLPVQAGGTDLLRLEDGTAVERARRAEVAELLAALRAIAGRGPQAFEPAREQSLLAAVDQKLDARERELREQQSAAIVRKYTRRAVIGALAAVAPGTDLLIQGALGTAMVRELAAAHGLRMRDVDIDGLIDNAGGIVRTSAAVTLAIAGNALKALPGIGTVGGGLVHAVAYGLVFDSLGRAVAATLAQARGLDRQATLDAFEEQLRRPSRERLAAVLAIAREALDNHGDDEATR